MIYRCVEEFSVDEYDADGFRTDNQVNIEEGSTWELDASGASIIGGDVHLDNTNDYSWLELPTELLDQCFVVESEGKE